MDALNGSLVMDAEKWSRKTYGRSEPTATEV
jgi:hypothetical protein